MTDPIEPEEFDADAIAAALTAGDVVMVGLVRHVADHDDLHIDCLVCGAARVFTRSSAVAMSRFIDEWAPFVALHQHAGAQA